MRKVYDWASYSPISTSRGSFRQLLPRATCAHATTPLAADYGNVHFLVLRIIIISVCRCPFYFHHRADLLQAPNYLSDFTAEHTQNMSSSFFYSQCDCPTCSPILHRALLNQSPPVAIASIHLSTPAFETVVPEINNSIDTSLEASPAWPAISPIQTSNSPFTRKRARNLSSSSTATRASSSTSTSTSTSSSSTHTLAKKVLSKVSLLLESSETRVAQSQSKPSPRRPTMRRAQSASGHPTHADLIDAGMNISIHPYQYLDDSHHTTAGLTILEEGWVHLQTNLKTGGDQTR